MPLNPPLSAGVDAARAFGTGCFKTHLTHDLRGMSEDELRVNAEPFLSNDNHYCEVNLTLFLFLFHRV